MGFKPQHFTDIVANAPDLGFFEVHAENYMGAGGLPHVQLEKIRNAYPLSVHGVGLSLGTASGLDKVHLDRLRLVVERYEPALVSEHLAWSAHGPTYLNDLLALPYNTETLDAVSTHIDQTQSFLGRQILLENPSTYIHFTTSTWDEADFISEVVRRTGCGVLLDLNNAYVSAINQGTDAYDYLRRFPMSAVNEIHLAGYSEDRDNDGNRLLIDTHSGPVHDPVLDLYSHALCLTGPVPTLIEWDTDLPAWSELMHEARRAHAVMDGACKTRRSHVA
ncbi:MAG: DUF692 domain-containing protein [Rhodospirillales bacterium]